MNHKLEGTAAAEPDDVELAAITVALGGLSLTAGPRAGKAGLFFEPGTRHPCAQWSR